MIYFNLIKPRKLCQTFVYTIIINSFDKYFQSLSRLKRTLFVFVFWLKLMFFQKQILEDPPNIFFKYLENQEQILKIFK